MVDYQTLSITLTGIGMIIALTYYALQIRNQNKTRQVQLFMEVYNNHISLLTTTILQELLWGWNWEDYDDYIEKYGASNNMEAHAKFAHYFASLEGIGVLCRKGFIAPELVYRSQYASIIGMWEKFLPIISELRQRMNAPHLYEDPEYLYNEMIRIREKLGHQPVNVSQDVWNA